MQDNYDVIVVGSGAGAFISALAAATLTLAAGGPYTIRGAALLTADGKSATTGLLLVAARFGADMTGLQAGSKLSFEYTLSALDEGA